MAQEQGGVASMQKINERKAAILYEFLDNSRMFKATVEPQYRSLMNVPFVAASDELNKEFIKGRQRWICQQRTPAGWRNAGKHLQCDA